MTESTLHRGRASSPRERRERLPRAHVAAVQRARIMAAAAETVAEVGYARTAVSHVVGRARVSRKTFYDVFSDREDCFLAVFGDCLERARASVDAACAAETTWNGAVRAGLARLLELLDAEPVLARICIVEALAAGERVLARRAIALATAAAAIDRGREHAPAGLQPPPLTAQTLAGGVLSVLHAHITSGPEASAAELLAPLASTIVLPYLGAEAAARELSRGRRPVGAEREPQLAVATADPLAGIGMRLTYRTLRVLAVIAAHPGASNRQIAGRAGVADQGQISKLLARLARLGLVANRGEGQAGGGPNAWHLTPRGAGVVRAARVA
jgi:AcrR family transcriptional regulator